MSSSDKYKKRDNERSLAGGNVESLDGSAMNEDSYDNFRMILPIVPAKMKDTAYSNVLFITIMFHRNKWNPNYKKRSPRLSQTNGMM